MLSRDIDKQIILDSFQFLVNAQRIKVTAFVLMDTHFMDTHFHLICQVLRDHHREDVQRDFLRYTAQQILKQLRKLEYIHNSPVKAGLCALPEDYRYSSARFYELNINDWDFLTHYED